MNSQSLHDLLARYPADCWPQELRDLGGAGGFSGAAFWRITSERGLLCLRRWPTHVDPKWVERLDFIHAVLDHVARRGFSLAPTPIRTRHGESHVRWDGHDWELSAWLPGRADYFPMRQPEKLRAALSALAEFHRAAADFDGLVSRPAFSASPGVLTRRRQIEALRAGGLAAIVAAVDNATHSLHGNSSRDWIAIVDLARRLLPLYAQAEEPVCKSLVAAERRSVPLQPCVRDIWHDHVLFLENRVSGLIDFGAMRIDNVAGDVARLLGSFSFDDSKKKSDAEAWEKGLAAYEAVRRLSADERQLVGVFDHSTTLLAGINWLQWLFVERRTFADLAAVRVRLAAIVARLERLTQAWQSTSDSAAGGFSPL
jgi:homoserine kinase type II